MRMRCARQAPSTRVIRLPRKYHFFLFQSVVRLPRKYHFHVSNQNLSGLPRNTSSSRRSLGVNSTAQSPPKEKKAKRKKRILVWLPGRKRKKHADLGVVVQHEQIGVLVVAQARGVAQACAPPRAVHQPGPFFSVLFAAVHRAFFVLTASWAATQGLTLERGE